MRGAAGSAARPGQLLYSRTPPSRHGLRPAAGLGVFPGAPGRRRVLACRRQRSGAGRGPARPSRNAPGGCGLQTWGDPDAWQQTPARPPPPFPPPPPPPRRRGCVGLHPAWAWGCRQDTGTQARPAMAFPPGVGEQTGGSGLAWPGLAGPPSSPPARGPASPQPGGERADGRGPRRGGCSPPLPPRAPQPRDLMLEEAPGRPRRSHPEAAGGRGRGRH